MQNNFKKITFFVLTILLFALVLVFLFVYKKIDSNEAKTQNSMTEVENELSRRAEIQALNLSINSIKVDKTALETHFAKSSDIVPFLDTIESLAPKAGAKAQVTSVNILKDSSTLAVQINASGSFGGIYKFLTLLENSPYELEFTGVDMQKQGVVKAPDGSAGSQSPEWEAIIGVRLLSFIQ
jgi:Tfp pilus assembly protein PilN